MAAAESYPDELKYHSEHDWARIDGDEATLGITWFAQDALGELVHYEPPNEGDSIAKDSAYGSPDGAVDQLPEDVRTRLQAALQKMRDDTSGFANAEVQRELRELVAALPVR